MNKKIAIPMTNNVLSAHFGHCEKFAIYTVVNSEIVKEELITPPPHEPGSHPRFLKDLGCETIIAGGMGEKAQALFAQNNIEVYIGVPEIPLTELVERYVNSELKSGDNRCDH